MADAKLDTTRAVLAGTAVDAFWREGLAHRYAFTHELAKVANYLVSQSVDACLGGSSHPAAHHKKPKPESCRSKAWAGLDRWGRARRDPEKDFHAQNDAIYKPRRVRSRPRRVPPSVFLHESDEGFEERMRHEREGVVLVIDDWVNSDF